MKEVNAYDIGYIFVPLSVEENLLIVMAVELFPDWHYIALN